MHGSLDPFPANKRFFFFLHEHSAALSPPERHRHAAVPPGPTRSQQPHEKRGCGRGGPLINIQPLSKSPNTQTIPRIITDKSLTQTQVVKLVYSLAHTLTGAVGSVPSDKRSLRDSRRNPSFLLVFLGGFFQAKI